MTYLRQSHAYSLSKEDVAWLAGIIEGEGCIHRHGGYAGLKLQMTDRDVIERAGKMLNAPVYPRGRIPNRPAHHKDAWGTEAHGARCREILERVLPLMGERRARKIIDVLSMPTWGFPDSLKQRAAFARAAKLARHA